MPRGGQDVEEKGMLPSRDRQLMYLNSSLHPPSPPSSQELESKAVDHYPTPRERPMDKTNKQETALSCNQTHKRQRPTSTSIQATPCRNSGDIHEDSRSSSLLTTAYGSDTGRGHHVS